MSSDQLSFFDRNDRERSLFEPKASETRPANFSITRTINAPAQKVFDQWLIPVFLGDWMFGPKVQREKVLSLENKVCKGGEYKFLINRKGQEMHITGEIKELDIPNSLTLSWIESIHPESESLISAQFNSLSDKTKLKLSIKLPVELAAHKESIKKLWTKRLATLAAKLK
ncbi:MAG: SRPBCC domain-containing protein [Gammaproteobacteria bacterium]|nr:SRPBCC domain-containing protein [Gammaproteobacteria bacterium]MDD9896705.1 SRPBCC domain-containing protein [Gammaproteobacteria bacterium]MDD9959561.1 SRPBCC domain-containing protein [Gammaproteobacteria bacterium]